MSAAFQKVCRCSCACLACSWVGPRPRTRPAPCQVAVAPSRQRHGPRLAGAGLGRRSGTSGPAAEAAGSIDLAVKRRSDVHRAGSHLLLACRQGQDGGQTPQAPSLSTGADAAWTLVALQAQSARDLACRSAQKLGRGPQHRGQEASQGEFIGRECTGGDGLPSISLGCAGRLDVMKAARRSSAWV